MKNQNRPARNAPTRLASESVAGRLQRNAGGGFIKITIILIAGLVLLKYVYDIDVLDRVYDAWLWLWGKYGDSILKAWEWVKAKIGMEA